MDISINLNDSAGMNAALTRIQTYASTFSDRCSRLCERLAEIGRDVLSTTYTAAAYAGTNDISVSMEPAENGYRLSANGSVLGFVEFGTGVSYPLGDYAGQVGAPGHGTYGKGKGNQPQWVYIGNPGNIGVVIKSTPRGNVVRTSGNPPANAFPAAVEAMRNSFAQVAEEVFRI